MTFVIDAPGLDSAGLKDVMRGVDMTAIDRASLGSKVIPMHKLLANICAINNCDFVRNGVSVDAQTIMSPDMFLPVLAWASQQAAHRLWGIDLGCSLRRSDTSLFGVRGVIPPMTAHIGDLFRTLLFVHFAGEIFGLQKDSLIEVQPMVDMLKADVFDALIQTQNVEVGGDIKWPQPFPTN